MVADFALVVWPSTIRLLPVNRASEIRYQRVEPTLADRKRLKQKVRMQTGKGQGVDSYRE